MKYYLLSKSLKFERFFDSIDEVCEYIKAQTGAIYFDYNHLKEHLKDNNSYTYAGWGIDLAIYKRNSVTINTDSNSASQRDVPQ